MLDLTQLDEAVRSEGGITRRLLLAYGAALAALPTLGLRAEDKGKKADPKPKKTTKLPANPFSLGVASGDPTDDGVVIWTRLAPKPLQQDGGMPHDHVDVHWELASDDKMKNVVHKGTFS